MFQDDQIDIFIIVGVLLILGFSYPSMFLLRHLIRQFKLKNWAKVYNYSINLIIFIINLYFILLLYRQMIYITDFLFFTLLTLILIIPLFVLWGSSLIYTIFYKIFGNSEKFEAYKQKKRQGSSRNASIEDFKRKFNHIIFYGGIWLGILIYMYISRIWMKDIVYNAWRWWEYNLNNPTETFWFIQFLKSPSFSLYEKAGWNHLFIIIFYIDFSYVSLSMEAFRHSKYIHSIFEKPITIFLRKEEIDDIATYFESALAFTTISFILPPVLIITIMGVGLIADMMASQVGIKFGKHKIPFNKKKSWEGLIGGSVTSFLITSIFLGTYYGLLFSIVFLILDVLTPNILKVSDNLLLPLVLMFICLLLNYLSIPYPFPTFLNFFAPV